MATIRIGILKIAVLSALRYLIVCHEKQLKLWIWLVNLIMPDLSAIMFFGVGVYTNYAIPSASYLYCFSFAVPGKFSQVMSFITLFFYIVPCWINTYCYFCIGWTANKKLNRMKQEAISNSDESMLKTIKNEKIKLSIQTLFVF